MSTDETSAAAEIDAIITAAGGWRGETLARIRQIILSADPEITEEIKWRKPSKPEGVATWVLHGNVCMADIMKSAVRLTFPQGAELDDTMGLFNSRLDGRTVRAIDVFEDSMVPEEPLRALVRSAVRRDRGA